MRRRLVGPGWRPGIARWIEGAPPEAECLELTAEHFFDAPGERPGAGEARAAALGARLPCFVHGLGLSLGTPGPLDEGALERFAGVAAAARARWVSEHVAFTRTAEVDLGHLNPVRPTRETLREMAAHAREVAERCGRPLLLENITTHVRLEGDFGEPELLNRICAESGAGLLLDVTNLFVNARNHGFDARAWLREVRADAIRQLHVVGYARRGSRLGDAHAEAIQDDLMDLVREVLDRAPVEAVILERDVDVRAGAVAAELVRLRQACDSPTPSPAS